MAQRWRSQSSHGCRRSARVLDEQAVTGLAVVHTGDGQNGRGGEE